MPILWTGQLSPTIKKCTNLHSSDCKLSRKQRRAEKERLIEITDQMDALFTEHHNTHRWI